jgi:hypothetical protein
MAHEGITMYAKSKSKGREIFAYDNSNRQSNVWWSQTLMAACGSFCLDRHRLRTLCRQVLFSLVASVTISTVALVSTSFFHFTARYGVASSEEAVQVKILK